MSATNTSTPPYLPLVIDKVDRIFGGSAMKILPPMSRIPSEFRNGSSSWNKWQREWFFAGLQRWPVPKEGIDLTQAMSNLACANASFEPKHEHKEAGVAYLASLWFTSPEGEKIAKATGSAA